MQININQFIEQSLTTEQRIGAELIKSLGLDGYAMDGLSLLDIFGAPGNSAMTSSAGRDIEQIRGWNHTAILAKALQFTLGSVGVFCPLPTAEAISSHYGEEYAAASRFTGMEQYGVPENWVQSPRHHRVAKLMKKPHPWCDEAQMLFQMAQQVEVHGVCYFLILPNQAGLPSEMWIIPKVNITPLSPSLKFPEGSYRVGNLSRVSIGNTTDRNPESHQEALSRLSNKEYSARWVIPVGLPSIVYSDDFLNMSAAIADALDTDSQIHQSRRKTLSKQMTNGPRLEPLPGTDFQASERDKLLETFESQNLGPENQGRPWMSPKGVKVVDDSHSAREMEYTDSANQSRDHVMGQRLMPSKLLGLGEGGAYAEIIGIIKSNNRNVLQPLMKILSGQLTIGLQRYFDAPQDDFMVLIQAGSIDDPEQKMREWNLLIGAKTITKGQILKAFNLPPFGDQRDDEIAGVDPAPASDPAQPGGIAGLLQGAGKVPEKGIKGGEIGPEKPGIGAAVPPEGKEIDKAAPNVFGGLTRQQFVRNRKAVMETLQQFENGTIRERTAIATLKTLGLSSEQAREFVDSVKEDQPVPAVPQAEVAEQKTVQPVAAAMFSRMLEPTPIDRAAATAQTSGQGDLRYPTQQELQSGAYKKGRFRIAGLAIAIENPARSKRSGVDESGKPWSVELNSHYGYIMGSTGFDKDQVDVYFPEYTDPSFDGMVYVINQANADGTFDEHKVVIGCNSKRAAKGEYLSNYQEGWESRIMSIAALPMGPFKRWLFDPADGPTAGELKPVTALQYVSVGVSRPERLGATVSKSWDESRIVRHQRGGEDGGQFAPKHQASGDVYSIDWQDDVDANQFLEAKNKSSKSVFLSSIDADSLAGHQLILSKDGTIGAAVSSDGDIQNVFNNGGKKGTAQEVMIRAIVSGGKTLDCYAGFLPGYYANFGFEETGRMKFNREYAPDGWDYEKYGEPDVVFMGIKEEVTPDVARENVKSWKQSGTKQPAASEVYYSGEEWDQAKSDSRGTGLREGLGTKSWKADERSGDSLFDRSDEGHRRTLTSQFGKSSDYDDRLKKLQQRRGEDTHGVARTESAQIAERANLIADILVGAFGDDAEQMLADGHDFGMLTKMFAKLWDESKYHRHPAGARFGGRFAPKNSPEAVTAVHGAIDEALRGARSDESASELVDLLSNLTLNQLRDVKDKYQMSASGRTKKDLVAKIAARLDSGRRAEAPAPAPAPEPVPAPAPVAVTPQMSPEVREALRQRMYPIINDEELTNAERQYERGNISGQEMLSALDAFDQRQAILEEETRVIIERQNAELNAREAARVAEAEAAVQAAAQAETARAAAAQAAVGQMRPTPAQLASLSTISNGDAWIITQETGRGTVITRTGNEWAIIRSNGDVATANPVFGDRLSAIVTEGGAAMMTREAATQTPAPTPAAPVETPTVTESQIRSMTNHGRLEAHMVTTGPDRGSVVFRNQNGWNLVTRDGALFDSRHVSEQDARQMMSDGAAAQIGISNRVSQPISSTPDRSPARDRGIETYSYEGGFQARQRLERIAANMPAGMVANIGEEGQPPSGRLRALETQLADAGYHPEDVANGIIIRGSRLTSEESAPAPTHADENRLADLRRNLPNTMTISTDSDGTELLVTKRGETRLPSQITEQIVAIEQELRSHGHSPDNIAAGRTPAPVQAPSTPAPRGSKKKQLEDIGAAFLDKITPDADGNLIKPRVSKAKLIVDQQGDLPEWTAIAIEERRNIEEHWRSTTRREMKTSASLNRQWKMDATSEAQAHVDGMTLTHIANEIHPTITKVPGYENATVADVATMVRTFDTTATQLADEYREKVKASEIETRLDGRKSWLKAKFKAELALRELSKSQEGWKEYASVNGLLDHYKNPDIAAKLTQFGLTMRDLPSMIGAPDNVTFHVRASYDGGINLSSSGDVSMDRTIHLDSDGRLVVHNNSFFLDDDMPKGTGLEILANAVGYAKSKGVYKFYTNPCRSEGYTRSDGTFKSGMVGYAVWPQFGYDAPISEIRNSTILSDLRREFPNAQTIRDVYDTPGGQAWWWKNGHSIGKAEFFMEDGSRNMKAMQKYMASKKSARARVKAGK